MAVGIIGHYITWNSYSEYQVSELFFLLISTTCLIATSLLLFSCIFSIATAAILPKTLFVSFYRFLFYLSFHSFIFMSFISLRHKIKFLAFFKKISSHTVNIAELKKLILNLKTEIIGYRFFLANFYFFLAYPGRNINWLFLMLLNII